MSRLLDRNKFIPGGFQYYQPETGWKSPRMASFETIVSAIIAHRQANSWLIEKNKWSVDPETVRDELDAYNTKICQQMGWNSYISGAGGPSLPPNPQLPRSQQIARRVGNVVAGAETLVDWIKDGSEAVSPEQSAQRAEVCVACPKNNPGDLLSFFTRPAAEAIRRTIEKKNEMNLSTPSDDKLGVCDACDCPLKLKVHLPITFIRPRISQAVKSELDPACWMLKEGV